MLARNKKQEINNELTMKKPERSQRRRPNKVVVDFEHISHLVLVILLLTFSIYLFAELDEYNTA